MNLLLLHNRADLHAGLLRSFTKLWIWVGHFHKVGLQRERESESTKNVHHLETSASCYDQNSAGVITTVWFNKALPDPLGSVPCSCRRMQQLYLISNICPNLFSDLFLCSSVTVLNSPDRPLCTGHRRAGRRTRLSPPLGSRNRPSPADALCSSELCLWLLQSLQDSWALARQTNPSRSVTDTVLVWVRARQRPDITAVKLV